MRIRSFVFPLLIAVGASVAGPAIGGEVLAVRGLVGLSGGRGVVDGPGLDARFSFPTGIAVGPGDEIYVADTSNSTIRKITPDGTVSTYAGKAGEYGGENGFRTEARFYSPRALAVGPSGALYVAEDGGHTVRRISPDGTVSTLAGKYGVPGSANGPGPESRLSFARGVAVDSSENVYVSDQGNGYIRKIDRNGIVSIYGGLVSGGRTNQFKSSTPEGLAFGNDGSLYVASWDTGQIFVVSPGGIATLFSGKFGNNITIGLDGSRTVARFAQPTGLAFGRDGILYVTEAFGGIRKVASDGSASTLAGTWTFGGVDGAGSIARFRGPRGAAFLSNGNLVVVDTANAAVRNVTPDGYTTTLAGTLASSTDGTVEKARLSEPGGLSTGPDGTLYFTEPGSYLVRAVLPDGHVMTLAGVAGERGATNGPVAGARFNYPTRVIRLEDGSLIVADSANRCLRKISTEGVVTTFSGTIGKYGNIDGSAEVALFASPTDMAPDAFGNLLVADDSNNNLRKVLSDGSVTTLAGFYNLTTDVDGPVANATFNRPSGLAVNADGAVYVLERERHVLRKIDTNGMVTTFAGSFNQPGIIDGLGSAARFNYPSALCALPDGSLLVADGQGRTIRRVGSKGLVETLGGRPGIYGAHLGIGSEAQFIYPAGITVAPSGKIYISDQSDNVIREAMQVAEPVPSLGVSVVGGQAIASWPLGPYGYVVESKSSLSLGGIWTPSTNVPAIINDHYSVAQPTTGSETYLRLRKP